VAISVKHPGFPGFFFLREHFGRFLSPDHDRTAPVWFIPAVLAGGCLPWALFFLPPLFRGWRRPPQGGFSAPLLFRCWVVAIAGFFALSSSKMLGYIGPVFPALALLAAPEVAGAGPGRFRWTAGITIAGGCAAVVLAFFLPGLGTLEAPPEMLRRCTPFLIGTASVLAIGGGACLLALRRATNAKATLALAFVWLVALQILLAGSIGFSPMQSSRDLALQIRPVLEPESVLFSVDSYDQSLPFYVDRTAVIVKRRSEMGFGIEREPGKWIPDIPAFGAAWARSPAPVAVVPLKRVPEVQALGLDLREIARDHHRVVYAKKVNVGAR
jgi:4-amino-4-deoxy-L-arabinose transferase-like glycosyltransferase